MEYRASCHCGRVSLKFDADLKEVAACNCSICQRKGSLLWFAPRAQVEMLCAPDAAATYLFNKHAIKHRFCPTCGIHVYGEGKDPRGNEMVAINVRCVEGIDPASLPVRHFDGRSL